MPCDIRYIKHCLVRLTNKVRTCHIIYHLKGLVIHNAMKIPRKCDCNLCNRISKCFAPSSKGQV